MANWGQGAAGGFGGAATGAQIGSIVPGVGTAVGAGVGGVLGLLTGLFSGNKKPWEQSPNRFSPQQQKAQNMLLSNGTQQLQNPYAGFEPIGQYAQNKFKTESIPGLAERFTALGGSDTRGQSSDFAGMLSGAQSDFDLGLAGLRSQYGQQNQQNALQMIQAGLTPQHEQIYFGQGPQVGNQLLEQAGSLAGKYFENGGFGGNNNATSGGTGLLAGLNPQQKQMLAGFIQRAQAAGIK